MPFTHLDKNSMRITRALVTLVFVGAFIYAAVGSGIGKNLPDPYQIDFTQSVTDTIPITDNYGDHITDPNKNPFDITSNVIEQKVEYDPDSGHYIIFEKIGDEYYRTPTYLTFEEYLDFQKKKQQKEYFNRLAGITNKKKGLNSKLDPMERIDVQNSLVDRLFGGTEVNIQPQGQIDVTLQSTYYNSFQQSFGRTGSVQFNPIDPDVDISVSVDGNIGTKMNLAFNYDTQSTFDFDRKIKLEYDTEAFGEDDIIKKIEAGNVSLPLRGNLIQGAQSLFGLKTELQFGHLRLTAIASQQQSSQNNLTIENGASIQKFELAPDEYDENRHFFLSHYNRETFEKNLSNLPQIATSFRISQLEVWISNTGNTGQNYRAGTADIVAISDLAEPDLDKYTGQDNIYRTIYGPLPGLDPSIFEDVNDSLLPDNRVNPIFDLIAISNDSIEDRDLVSDELTRNGFVENRDFEAFSGRKLTSSEYSYNEQLGFLSLNIRLRANQALAVAYNYTYTANCDEVYNVGNLSADGTQFSNPTPMSQDTMLESESPKVLFTKLIKATNQNTRSPQWDLMMKNVYPLRASQIDPKEFKFDIFYEDDTDGTLKKFIPEPGFETRPLLEVFNLDRLNRYNDPQSDGIFDFVPGVTIIPNSGSVVFPVLEPFGSSLDELLGPSIAAKYKYQELYDTSVTIAGFALEKNKFLIVGEVKSATSGEINLGPFVPEGSVRVSAGGIQLVEGADFEVDYSLGRLRIINESYLQQGTPINVSFEDQALFSLQQKTMLGLRADYEFNDNLSIGATYLRLFERPFTEKVNIGNDPINNRIFGLDLAYSNEAPLITKMVDKLPFFSTKEASSISFSAEAAYLKPGHSGAINNGDEDGGVVSIDDFEGAVSGLLLGGFNTNQWRLASTPTDDRFPEATLNNNLLYGANRARTNWYVIDRQARGQEDFDNSYSRLIDQTDLFSREVQIGQSELITFDISYYPNERGPYNFDVPGGLKDTSVASGNISAGVIPGPNGEIFLDEPESRWGGIMRSFQNTDFEAANYEFIEFWMLNPYTPRPDGKQHATDEEGQIVFHLGNVSEDILKDGQQFYENSIPVDTSSVVNIKNTAWGKVPNITPISTGFVPNNIDLQDVGYDGLDNEEEKVKYQSYIDKIRMVQGFNNDILTDPCGDDYNFIEPENSPLDLLTRYKDFNNPQGNAPFGENPNGLFQRGNRFAESEDLNNNKFLDKGESYYEYVLNIEPTVSGLPGGLELNKVDNDYITQDTTIVNPSGEREKWYRVRIPITSDFNKRKNISGFRSIQFMKMYMTNFKSAKTFRMADFQLVRNLWRKKLPKCADDGATNVVFNVDEIGVEENGNKEPFGYVSPKDIKQERLFSTFSNLLQDEKSLALNFCELGDSCEVGINKLARLDLTLYEKLQLFFHAESAVNSDPIEEGDLYGYIRFGKDLVNHYYEYEIPLVISDPDGLDNQENIWPDTNIIDVKLEHFLKAKKDRIADGSSLVTITPIDDPDRADAKIYVKGTPSLAYIKVFEIGVRNKNQEDALCGSVWVNELRATGLNEQGGVAAQARLQIQMADLGEVNVAASYSSIGWGSLDQRLAERNREELLQYDIATNLQLGKFFPAKWGINLPFYAQYSKNNAFRQFEPYERDLTVDDKIEALTNKKANFPDQADEIDLEIQDVKDRSKETTTIKTFNFTNVKKEGSGGKPWSISNFSASYSYTATNKTDPIIKKDETKEYSATLDYNYSNKTKPIQPFKKIKSKSLRIIKEFNFNPLPKSFSFSTNMNRLTNTRIFRLPEKPEFQFDDRRFLWDRNYGLNWDFTKSLKFNFKARSSSIVDELRQTGIKNNAEDRDWVNERGDIVPIDDLSEVNDYRNNNLKKLGRNKNYNHNFGLQYTLPIRYLPMMDWINIKADYKGEYGWTAGSLILIDTNPGPNGEPGTLLGNIIQNKQTRSLNGTFSFDKLYNKSKYLKKIEKGNKVGRSSRKRTSRSRTPSKTKDGKDFKKEEKKDREVTKLERILIRPFLSLRSIKATYKESFGTFVPGFMPEAELLGLSSGFSSPGLNFAAGVQPELDNWLTDNREWFNPSPAFNDEISQTRQQNIDLKINLEPFKDFDIDIDFKKTYRYDHTEVFKNKDFDNPDYNRLAQYDIGSFEVSNMGLSTLFKDNIELYRAFQAERIKVSQAIGEPGTQHSDSWQNYTEGYGPNSYDVAVPAFLSTYVGIDPNTFAGDSTTIVDEVQKLSYLPKPNWTIKYDGLSKMAMFKDIFSSFSINHSYRGSMQVNRFNTTLEYRGNQELSPVNDNYYSRIQIPNIVLSDQFSPLIGISLKTKNDITFEAEWRKSRQMALALEELREQRSSEFRIGFGYTIKNFRSGKKNKKKRKRGQKDEEEDDKKSGGLAGGGRNNKGGVNNNRGKTLTMNFDFSINDTEELIYEVAQGIDPRPNSGQRTVQISPSIDYDVNENLTMRFFFDYNFSESKAFTANSNKRLNIKGGITAQLKIN